MKLKHFLPTALFAVSVTTLACSTQPASNNANTRVVNSNAQANSAKSNASSNKPSEQFATTGSIEVNSTPPGARILLVSTDESGAGEPQPKGLTPTTISGLSPGKYTVDLEKPGYKFFQKEVTVKAGTIVRISAALKKG
jgi:hypothetical protein